MEPQGMGLKKFLVRITWMGIAISIAGFLSNSVPQVIALMRSVAMDGDIYSPDTTLVSWAVLSALAVAALALVLRSVARQMERPVLIRAVKILCGYSLVLFLLYLLLLRLTSSLAGYLNGSDLSGEELTRMMIAYNSGTAFVGAALGSPVRIFSQLREMIYTPVSYLLGNGLVTSALDIVLRLAQCAFPSCLLLAKPRQREGKAGE